VPDRLAAWVKQLGLPFRLGSDVTPLGGVGKAWGVWNDDWNLEKRVTFVVDRQRRIRYVEVGGLAIDTSRTLEALTRLARAK
jgi:peroxiredoxin